MPPNKGAPLTVLDVVEAKLGSERPVDIMEFVLSDRWLNRPNLYPRQATLLKLITLQEETFTQFDYDVLGEWGEGFRLTDTPPDETVWKFSGDWGVQPDALDRLRYLRDVENRPWFRTILNVSGRRSGKGHLGAILGAWVLWHYISTGDPRSNFGVDPDKRLSCQVFAGKKEQAKANQWRDLVNVILGGPCFSEYVGTPLTESLTMLAPVDKIRLESLRKRGIKTEMDLATFEIVPKEATTMAARGPASFCQYYDEMAHMVSTTGGSRSAGEVWESATPSLDQFKKDAFIYCGSSPWEMTGKFYELCQQAVSIESDTRRPVYPESLIIQLPSWDIYVDWERTLIPFPVRPAYERNGEQVPERHFLPLKGAIQEYDSAMQRLERANPDTFRVERRAKWATAMDAYLPTEHVRKMFSPWNGRTLTMQQTGSPTLDYIMHGDPGQTGSNFGFAVAHRESVEGSDFPHVVFDFIVGWSPGDFESMEMDYIVIEDRIKDLVDRFLPSDVTFDQWNSIGLIQRLQKHANRNFKPCSVSERTATASVNWRTAETFKTALSLGLIHSPYYELAELECMFLRKLPGDKVDHPATGPCTTKDVYDAMSICVQKLIGNEISAFLGAEFMSLELVGAMPGPGGDQRIAQAFSEFGASGPRNVSPRGTGPTPSGRLTRTPGTPRRGRS